VRNNTFYDDYNFQPLYNVNPKRYIITLTCDIHWLYLDGCFTTLNLQLVVRLHVTRTPWTHDQTCTH